MIRLAQAKDEPAIRHCAEQAYARYVPELGRKPAPMTADFTAQIAAGSVYVATNEQATLEGFVVFYVEQGHVHFEKHLV